MKKIKFLFLLFALSLFTFGISSCGEDEPEEEAIPATCLSAGTTLVSAAEAFEATPNETTCLAGQTAVAAFTAACDIQDFIDAGIITQAEYNEIIDAIKDVDCSMF